MSVTIAIPASLRRFSNGAATATLPVDTLATSYRRPAELYPELGRSIFAEGPMPFSFIRVFVNAQDCSRVDGGTVMLQDGDRVSLLPAFAGG